MSTAVPSGPASPPSTGSSSSTPVTVPPALASREPRVVDRGIARHESLLAALWRVDGTVKVTRDVDASRAELRGTVSVGGRLAADTLTSRGVLEVGGALDVRSVGRIRGSVRASGPVEARELTVEGSARLESAFAVERTCSIRGSLSAPSVRAGILLLEGEARIPGEVEALRVDATFLRPSALGTVRSPIVRLRGHLPNLVDKVFFHIERSRVERVEADRAELEGIDVHFVRAEQIVLGRGCHVTEVEGTIVRRHPTSSVGPQSKSPPPYGLRR